MERSAIRDSLTASTLPPDFAALHPGYKVPRSAVIEMYVRVLAARCARALLKFLSLRREGAGNAGCLLHPRSRVQDRDRDAHEHTGTAGALRHSLRNGLTAYAALSLETNSSCLHHCRLDGSIDPVGSKSPPAAWHQPRVSGPHGFAVRFSTVRPARRARSRITALRTTSRA